VKRQAGSSGYPPRVVMVAKTVLGLALLLPGLAFAQQQPGNPLERPPDIPPEDAAERPGTPAVAPAGDAEALPPKVQDEQLEPSVTIRDEEGKRIEEYSQNGRVYMVKVTPENGIPYYYIDSDGDGRLETTPAKDLEQVRPVYWKVKEWD